MPEEATIPSPKKRCHVFGDWLWRVAHLVLPVVSGPTEDRDEVSVMRPCATGFDTPSLGPSPGVQRPLPSAFKRGGSDHAVGGGASPKPIRKLSVKDVPTGSRRVSCQVEPVSRAGVSDYSEGDGEGEPSWQRMEALLTRMQAHHDAVVERSEARIMRALQHERLLIQKLLANNSSTSGVESAMLRVMPFYDFSAKRH